MHKRKLLSCALVSILVFSQIGILPIFAQDLAATDENITVNKNTSYYGTLKAQGGEDNIFQIVTEPEHGTITQLVATTGAYVYTPDTDYTGSDEFQFEAIQTTDIKDTGTISITVTENGDSSPSPTPVTENGDPSPSPTPVTENGDPSPSPEPTLEPTPEATLEPTPEPTLEPTPEPTLEPTPEPYIKYKDLVNHWAYKSAGIIGYKGIIVGEIMNNNYYFYPDRVMNRAEFTLFLINVMGLNNNGSEVDYTTVFADEEKIPSWVLKEAKLAKKAQIINGVEQNGSVYFKPSGKLTRIEAIVMLNNAATPTAQNNDELTFYDKNQIPLWGVSAVKNMLGWGLIRGYDDNTLKPFEEITRAQAIEMLYQLMVFNEVPGFSTRMAHQEAIKQLIF